MRADCQELMMAKKVGDRRREAGCPNILFGQCVNIKFSDGPGVCADEDGPSHDHTGKGCLGPLPLTMTIKRWQPYWQPANPYVSL